MDCMEPIDFEEEISMWHCSDYIKTTTRSLLESNKSKEAKIAELEQQVKDQKALINNIKNVVKEQAEDEGLWFEAEYVSEDYLQRSLRRLHAAIEAKEQG